MKNLILVLLMAVLAVGAMFGTTGFKTLGNEVPQVNNPAYSGDTTSGEVTDDEAASAANESGNPVSNFVTGFNQGLQNVERCGGLAPLTLTGGGSCDALRQR